MAQWGALPIPENRRCSRYDITTRPSPATILPLSMFPFVVLRSQNFLVRSRVALNLAALHGDRARLFESSATIAAAIDQAQLEHLNAEAALRRHAHEASSRSLLEDRLSCADRIRVQSVESGRPGAERRSPKRDGESGNATRNNQTSLARPA